MPIIKAPISDVQHAAWQRGGLSWILYPHQRPIYKKIREVIDSQDIDANSYVLDISRQFGKSFCMFLVAVEECLRSPYVTVVYIAPLKKQVVEIVTENTFRKLFATAPKHCIPVFKDSELQFQNGSRIRLAGTDNKNYDGLRGGAAHLILLDEGGFMSDLSTGVLPTVLPMTKTTGGKIIFASTPPEALDHDFYEILREHDESGNISTFTILDDKSLTQRQFDTIVSACKGQDTTLFKREYLCQRIAESSMQVIPELGQTQAAKCIYNEDPQKDPLFKFYKKYIIVDWGGRDLNAIIFAYYDYRKKIVIVQDQLSLQGEDISAGRIATEIKNMRDKLWTYEQQFDESNNQRVSYICDSNNIIVQNEMVVKHSLPFRSTTKENLIDQMVQKVRDWAYDERIVFCPAAEFTLKSLSSAHWDRARSKFARSKTYGHYDHTACIVYLIRNIDERTDPIPRMLNVDPYNMHIDANFKKDDLQGIQAIFGARKGLSFK